MKQLSGLDATFLYMETPTTFAHVSGLTIFERPSPDYDSYAAVYAKYASLVEWAQPPQPASPRRRPVKLTQAATRRTAKKSTSTTRRARR